MAHDYFATPENDFVNRIYSIHKPLRDRWEMREASPPYGLTVADGEDRLETPFANCKTYADCFDKRGSGDPTKPSRLRRRAG